VQLPAGVLALLFDLDGVLTDTAAVHNSAWKAMFDEFLEKRDGEGFVPFDPAADYLRHVDGKRREDGVRAFLASRGVELPEGDPQDPPGAETVHGLGNRKNEQLLACIQRDGVTVLEDGRRLLQAARDAGLRTAVVSSSANTAQVLQVTGLAELVDVRVDGVTARERDLPGKPAADTFLAAAAELGVLPSQAVVVEDALSGVQAGRAGGFALVVGVDRVGQALALRTHGADVVVEDLRELL
jgi:beta-phosphoglucomutase family hydrolase